MNTIYISKRCNICHELLILIHKNKQLLNKYKIVDIDTNPFPNLITYVPTLYLAEGLIIGDELFKYLNGILNMDTRVTPPLEESTKPILSKDEKVEKKDTNDEDGLLNGYCVNGMCGLSFSSLEEDDEKFNSFHKDDKYEMVEGGLNLEQNKDDLNNQESLDKGDLSKKYEKLMEERNALLNSNKPPTQNTMNI